MKSPWVPFHYYLAGGIGGQPGFIAEPTWLASGSQTNPIGTGPFMFKAWTPNDHFTATKNPTTGARASPTSTASPTSPSPTRPAAGQPDRRRHRHHAHRPARGISQLRADTSLAYIDDSENVAGEPDMGFILLNLSKAPFDNLKLRQAMAIAISSAQYVEVIDKGVNATSNGPFTTTSPYYVADNGYPVSNVAKAKQLVTRRSQRPGSRCPSPSTTPRTPAPPRSPSTSSSSSRRSG